MDIQEELKMGLQDAKFMSVTMTPREVKQLYNNGTYLNNVIGESEKAISFYNNSIKDGIRLQDVNDYDLKGGSTFSFWAKTPSGLNTNYVLGFSSTDNTRTLNLDTVNDRITTLMVIILSVFAGQGFISWYLWSFISVPLLLWIWIFKRN